VPINPYYRTQHTFSPPRTASSPDLYADVALPIIPSRPEPSYMPEPIIPGSFMQYYPPGPNRSRSPSHVSESAPPLDCPPLIQASWTPPEIDWRWSNTPPGPMVVPNMLSEEESVRASPDLLHGVSEVLQPNINYESRPHRSSISSHLTTPHSGSVFDEDASPPGLRAPSPLPAESPLSRLINLEQSTTDVHRLDSSSTSSGSPITLTEPVPRLGPVQYEEWREFWPEMTNVLKHLLQPPTPPNAEASSATSNMPEVINEHFSRQPSSVSQEFETAAESPLGHEPLLSRPEGSDMVERSRDFGHNLVEYLNHVIPPMPHVPAPPRPRFSAAYISDNNIAEGQIFPPGAEFVKSWRMRNDGDTAWPENTVLRYVAGDRLAPRGVGTVPVHVGTVEPGNEVELVGGDMKAPEVSGKYVSYWRLHDGQQYFGSSVWVE
jgi:hypothetical protein